MSASAAPPSPIVPDLTPPTPSSPAGAPGAPEPAGFSMRRLGQHTLIYGIGMVLSKAVSFLMLPVYTRFLTPADYGVMELIELTLEVTALLAGARLALGIFRYYHKAGTEQERNAVVSTALLGLAATYGTLGALVALFAPLLSRLVFGSVVHAPLLRLAAANFALQALIIVPLSYARVKDLSMLYVGANLARLVIGLALNLILLVGLGLGVKAVFIANLAASATVGGALAWWTVRHVGIHFSRAATRDLLRYGVPLIGTQVATFILTFGDRYFLQAEVSTAAVGVYSLAYQFGFLLATIGYLPYSMVWEPARFKVVEMPDRDALLSRGFVYMNLSLCVLAVGMSLLVGDVLRVMATPAFHAAAQLVPVVLAAYVLQGWSSVLDVGLHVKERTGYVTAANTIAAVVSLAGYALLIRPLQLWGAALATLVAFAVRTLLVYVFSQRLLPVRYDWSAIGKAVGLSIVAVSLGYLLPPLPFVSSVALRLAIVAAFLVSLPLAGAIRASDRAAAVTLARRLLAPLLPARG